MVPYELVVEHVPAWLRNALCITGPQSEQYFAYLQRLKQSAELLLLRAAEASVYSASYRPFPVGCAVVGIGSHSLSMLRVFTGHNMKVHGEARVTCGEVIAIGGARQARCAHVPLIAVVGNAQVDHGSGKHFPTLHPCHRCRAEFQALDCITDTTVILTATFEAVARLREETETIFGRLMERHDERTGFIYYDPVIIADDQDPQIWLDDLVAEGVAEAMSLPQLLEKHAP